MRSSARPAAPTPSSSRRGPATPSAASSPVAHAQPPVTLIDRELFRFDEIWAAAGHPHGVFKLRPQDLERLTGAPVADVVQEPPA